MSTKWNIQKVNFDQVESLIDKICAKRITAAVQERDDMWRRHENAQILFLQNENSQMLTGLHAEIDRLHHHLRDLYHRLYVKSSANSTAKLENENEQLRKRLELAEQNANELNQKLEKCEKKSAAVEEQFSETIRMLKDQLAFQGNRIRQLTDELREKTAHMAKLMSQLPFGIASDASEADSSVVLKRFHSQPVVQWNAAPASFFGKKTKNLPRTGLTRSVSVSYPGGRPNVVVRRYNSTSSTTRSHHLPSLYSKPCNAMTSGFSIEKPIRLPLLILRDQMLYTRSLYEIQNSIFASSAESSTSTATTLKTSVFTNRSV
ncbi:unnamed protein product [Thelazia callipaeda]|uniref:CCDC92 domain-containing protein n=1 Tax=Thelazia callipaeda TaxID=103827 RepID=A0A0N5D7M7_THECL|nr:unnamed protein product [Thelazia callipaeda]